MGLRRLELALSSVGRRRFLTAVPGGGVTPASFSGLVLWAETVGGRVFTTATGSTAAGSTDPLGRVDPMQPGLLTLTQATAGNRPTLGLDAAGRLEARGDGVGAYLTLSQTLSLTDCTAYAMGTRSASGKIWEPFGSMSGSLVGIFSDNTSYFVPDSGLASVTANLTGNILGRWRRASGAVTFAGTGFAEASMGSAAATWTLNTLLARVGTDNTDAGNGVSKWVVFSRALSAAEMRTLEVSYFGGAL